MEETEALNRPIKTSKHIESFKLCLLRIYISVLKIRLQKIDNKNLGQALWFQTRETRKEISLRDCSSKLQLSILAGWNWEQALRLKPPEPLWIGRTNNKHNHNENDKKGFCQKNECLIFSSDLQKRRLIATVYGEKIIGLEFLPATEQEQHVISALISHRHFV